MKIQEIRFQKPGISKGNDDIKVPQVIHGGRASSPSSCLPLILMTKLDSEVVSLKMKTYDCSHEGFPPYIIIFMLFC
ncbi:hypothetical protein R3W88_014828 [Solanum pinnatisectum]|uniref:Uncharacterized protein n=1 Tax=Solanum pinnatisectum TaxID=50273 RepID=A0AAV9KV36_9SOLN|nr:hypothetical protein R3W88_014828 [Solanum pinnatisectum]